MVKTVPVIGKPQLGTDAQADDVDSEDRGLCVVCYARPIGAPLVPCGHQHFCDHCIPLFRRCPLCRSTLSAQPEEDESSATRAAPSILSWNEKFAIGLLISSVWAFIWIGSYSEWNHDVPSSYSPKTCEVGAKSTNRNKHDAGCKKCHEGYINFGFKCYEGLEDLPAVETGASLGGKFYFVLIIITQVCGALFEIFLIRRVQRQERLPRKELAILGIALAIELVRMFLIDIFVLQEYFDGDAYRIFREPIPCQRPQPYDTGTSWLGADSQSYCDDLSNHSSSTRYYIAIQRQAYSYNRGQCSTFTDSSPLLDFDSESGTWAFQFWSGGGHPRFSRLGWVIGGEFAFYYFFATFINEIADNVFVVPTTTNFGWFFKVFSIALELFQLGALCPAAIFTHGDCLHYTDPLGVPLGFIRDLVVSFGYTIAVLPFFAIPLALIGLGMLGTFLCLSGTCFQIILWPAARLRGRETVERLDRQRAVLKEKMRASLGVYRRGMGTLAIVVMLLSFLPLLFSGMFLGLLVVVGQASKKGGMQIMTAIVLMSDVLFKILATVATEIAEYALHIRVSRAVAGNVVPTSGSDVVASASSGVAVVG